MSSSQSPPGPPEYSAPTDQRGFLTRYAGLPASRFSLGTVGAAILIAFLTMQLGLVFVVIADPGIDTNAGKEAAQAVIALAFSGTALWFALRDARGGSGGALDRFGLRRVTLSVIGLAALAWFLYALVQSGLSPLIHPEQDDVTKELGTDDTSTLSVAVTAVLVIGGAAVSEELLFRGVIFAGLRRSLSLWPAALISSALWAVLHLAAANIAVVGVLALFGLVLAWLYERTGTLWAPICAHAINNSIAVLVLFAS